MTNLEEAQHVRAAITEADDAQFVPGQLADLVRAWVGRHRGAPVFVASDREFAGQFGDDHRGAGEMADSMNEGAARARDEVLLAVERGMTAAVAAGATEAAALLRGFDAASSLKLGYYDRMAVRRVLNDLLSALKLIITSGDIQSR